MTGRRSSAWLALALSLTAAQVGSAAAPNTQSSAVADKARVEAIRDALLRLPYYGVFDFLTFTYDKGTVVVGGYAYHGTLANDAERAVRRVAGVDNVTSKITALPVGAFDDDIRWRVFFAIYTHAFLEKYNPGGGLLWGHMHPLRRTAFGWSSVFPGMQPVGNYPIHIIVEGGRIRLLGVVDSETDKNVATMAARGVSGTFGVENQLEVDRPN
jgi:osmotically-inducible protein OsmY